MTDDHQRRAEDPRLKRIEEILGEHRNEFREFRDEARGLWWGKEGDPGVKIRLDRLEQSDASRRWHLRALWVAALAGIGGWIVRAFTGGPPPS